MLDLRRARLLLFGLVLVSDIGSCLILPFVDFSVNFWTFRNEAALVAVLALASVYCRFRSMRDLAFVLELICCGVLLSFPALFSSYVAMSLDRPLVDIQLEGMDRALGFDWISFVHVVDANALLSKLLFCSYLSFPYQLMALPCLLVFSMQTARAYCMVGGYGIICLVSALISVWYPALSAYHTHAIDPSTLHNVDAYFGYAFINQFSEVRQAGFVLSRQSAEGITTFPSVHAAVACLCAWACWQSRRIRIPILLLNLGMGAAAISHGSHYLVDVIAGIGVAGFTVAAICLCVGEHHAAPTEQLAG